MKKSAGSLAVILIGSFMLLLTATESNHLPGSTVAADGELQNHRHNRKKSRDLPVQLGSNDNQRISIVFQTDAAYSEGLEDFLKRNDIRRKVKFENMRAESIEVPAKVLNELAAFDEIRFISPDRELRSLGHLETATGAVAARLHGGNSALKGKDFNIAVVDSGID